MAAADVVTAMPPPDFRYRHLCDITSTLGGLFRRRLYTDLTLVVDGKYVRCHRVVLASASAYFHSRLYNGQKEHNVAKLFINDVSKDVLSEVLDFVYSGECRLSPDKAEDILKAAALFQLVALKDMCDFYLKDCVNTRNALRLYKISRATRSPLLEDKAREVVVQNLAHLWHTRLFRQLSQHELISLIGSHHQTPRNEDVVCAALITWVKADMRRRKRIMGETLKHVHLLKVRQETLRRLLEEEELVREDRVSTELIQEAITALDRPPSPPPSPIVSRSPVFQPRQEVKMDDVLVVMGGVEAEDSRFRSTQNVHAFNLTFRKWFPLPPLPLGCDSGATCCVKGNDIYVSGAGSTRQALVRYDSRQNEWTVLAPLITGRRGHCLVALNSHLYVVGGMAETESSAVSPSSPRPHALTATVERYHILSNTWTTVGALAEEVWGASAVAFKDKIHIFGGFQGKDRPTSVVQVFDPASRSSRITSQLPFPLALSRVVKTEDAIFIMGPSGNILSTSDCWRFSVAASIPDFQRALFGMTVHIGRLFVAGGRYGNTVHDDLLMVDVQHGTMAQLPQRLPRPMWGCGFVKVSINRAHMVKAGSEPSEY